MRSIVRYQVRRRQVSRHARHALVLVAARRHPWRGARVPRIEPPHGAAVPSPRIVGKNGAADGVERDGLDVVESRRVRGAAQLPVEHDYAGVR